MVDGYGEAAGASRSRSGRGWARWVWWARAGVLPVVAAALMMNPAAHAAEDPVAQRFGNDLYVAGSRVAVQTAVAGDAVAVGGRVAVTGRIGADALLAGGAISVESAVGEDLYAAGGEVRVASAVGDKARLAGGHVIIAPDADIAGGVTAAGGRVTVDGHVRRYALISAGRVEINGRIDGDLRVAARELSLGPAAVVQGRLDYRGAKPLQMAPGAQVQGGIDEAAPAARGGPSPAALAAGLVGGAVSAAVLVALAPGAWRRVSQALRARPVVAPLLGLALLVVLPLAIVLLMISVVGIGLGLLALLALIALILLGTLASAIAVGDLLVERRGPAGTWLRMLAAMVWVLVLFGLGYLPYVGWLVWLLLLLFGTGAIVLAIARAGRPFAARAAVP